MSFERQASCMDPQESRSLMPVSEARALLRERLAVVSQSESVPLEDALGRVLAQDIAAPFDVPNHTNSAMDGYAILAADLPAPGNTCSLEIVGEAWAGRPWDGQLVPGQAVGIATGAVMPAGSDTVVIIEHAKRTQSELLIGDDTRAYANVRQAGEDLQRGEPVLSQGTLVSPAEVCQLASLGFASLTVKRKLKVAVFSTGDELVSLREQAEPSLAPGQVFDSNRYTLCAMLQRLGVEVIDLGVVPDSSDATRSVFERAAECADVVVSSGGASVSDADHVSRTLGNLGEVTFWRLAMRPGRPLACGSLGNALFFGLPGNPVAVMVTFYQFVQPAIKHMMGCHVTEPILFKVRCDTALRKTLGRVEYQRGVFGQDDSGQLSVCTTGKQGAGRISSMTRANCFIVLHEDLESVNVGDWVDIQPFEGLV